MIFIFLIDISVRAVRDGSALASIRAVENLILSHTFQGKNTKIGIITFDDNIHFYDVRANVHETVRIMVLDPDEPQPPIPLSRWLFSPTTLKYEYHENEGNLESDPRSSPRSGIIDRRNNNTFNFSNNCENNNSSNNSSSDNNNNNDNKNEKNDVKDEDLLMILIKKIEKNCMQKMEIYDREQNEKNENFNNNNTNNNNNNLFSSSSSKSTHSCSMEALMTAEACLEKTGGKVILFSSSPIANTVYREKLKTEKYTNKMQNNINNSNNNHNYNNNNYSNSSSNSNNYSNNDNLNSNFNCKERERLSAYGTEDEISLYGNLETVLAHSQKQTGTDKQGKQEEERKLERNFIEKNLLLAEKFEKNKICVDLFFLIEDRLLSDRKKLNQKNSKNTKLQDLNFRDICVLSECCDRTGGHTHFVSGSMKIEENEKRLSDELIQSVSDTYAQDCVMKVRTNNGIKVGNYFGVGVYDALLGEVECSGLDTETTMCFTLRYNKNITIKDDEKVSIQIAILYTDVLTRKMVRVLNLVLTASVSPSVVFRHADLDCVVATITKIAVDRALRYPLSLQANVPITGQVVLTNETPCRDYLVSTTAKILKCYRLHCSPQSPRGQLILPEPLKLLCPGER